MSTQFNHVLPSADKFQPPLCVDLDGTLLNSDLFVESLAVFLRQEPSSIIQMLFWAARGKAFLKEQLVQRITIDVTTLPYHQKFLAYLKEHHAAGRKLVLATASHRIFAEQIAQHLGIFSAVFATEQGKNLAQNLKAECLTELYGERGFDYAGNSRADLAVWAHARNALLVNPVWGLKNRVPIPITEVFDDRRGIGKLYFQALHPLRWINNFLIFVPLFIYQHYADNALIHAAWAFLAFSLCGSSSYIFSDLLNLSEDRRSPSSNHNLFVTGRIPAIHAAALILILFGSGLFIAILTLPLEYFGIFFIYYLISVMYHVMMRSYSVFMKTLLYMIRIIVGNSIIM